MATEDHQADTTTTTTTTTATTATATLKTQHKYHELASHTIRAPTYAYAHLELLRHHQQSGSGPAAPVPAPPPEELDALQAKTYCAAALRQFLGATGAGIAASLDVLHVDGARCFVRLPRDDLAAFAAAVAAWQGVVSEDLDLGGRSTLRILGCSDWLGTLLGRQSEQRLWASG